MIDIEHAVSNCTSYKKVSSYFLLELYAVMAVLKHGKFSILPIRPKKLIKEINSYDDLTLQRLLNLKIFENCENSHKSSSIRRRINAMMISISMNPKIPIKTLSSSSSDRFNF